MGTTPDKNSGEKNSTEFKMFAAKRILLGVIGIVALLWLVSFALSFFDRPASDRGMQGSHLARVETGGELAPHETPDDTSAHEAATTAHATAPDSDALPASEAEPDTHRPPAAAPHGTNGAEDAPTAHDGVPAMAETGTAVNRQSTSATDSTMDAQAPAEEHGAKAAEEETAHGPAPHGPVAVSDILGVTFVDAMMAPMNYELNERFYGWRPNDIIEWTDNVNNYQLGLLEVTRRTAEVLADRISRTGSTQAFQKGLERVRSNFNINANQYLLPSAESSYGEALKLLAQYKQQLTEGTAYFYNRTDNLIPLLRAYENLLGSCDDNLVRTHEDDGSKVSWFKADNYFYYAQGVAAAMHSVLEAVGVDFAEVIETRRGSETLHHALENLHRATEIDPFLVLDSAPDSLMANHRANMAAPISHARFYIGLLIETLST
jgi:hypothetical protein